MKEKILALDGVFFALVLMLIMVWSMRKKGGNATLRDHLLGFLVLSVGFMLLLEIPYILLNGIARFARINFWINTAFHLSQVFPPILFILFIDYTIFKNKRRLRRTALTWLPFALIAMGMPLINIVWPIFYTIDAEGFYRREILLPLMFAFQYIPVIWVLWFLYDNRLRMERKTLYPLLFFPVPALVASIFQFLIPGLTLIWPFVSLGLLILYTSMQNRLLTEDYLTGAYNRRVLDEYLHAKVRHCRPGKTFSAFMIDLDSFKKINDRLGHKTGDEALIESVRILRSALRSSDFVARYAGDEFVIVLDSTNAHDLDTVVMRINQEIDKSNASGSRYYNLSFSIGMGIFDPLLDGNIENFMKRIDQSMYEIKRRKKNAMFVS